MRGSCHTYGSVGKAATSAEGELDEERGDERPQNDRPDQVPGPGLRARIELPSAGPTSPIPSVEIKVGEEAPRHKRDIEAEWERGEAERESTRCS